MISATPKHLLAEKVPGLLDRFSITDKSSLISLSADCLTATSGGQSQVNSSPQYVRSTTAKTSGKIYLEVSLRAMTPDIAIGLSNLRYNAVLTSFGGDRNSLGFFPSFGTEALHTQALYFDGKLLTALAFNADVSSSEGDVIRLACDFNRRRCWISSHAMTRAGYDWNNSTIAHPELDRGGIDFSNMGGPFYATFNEMEANGCVQINFGSLPFSHAIPLGFSSWDGHSVGTRITRRIFAATTTATTIITPTSGGSVTDSAGNVWTLDANGNLIENGADVEGGAGTNGLTVVNGVIWARDATSNEWYTYVDNGFTPQGAAQPPIGTSPVTPTTPTTTITTPSGPVSGGVGTSGLVTNNAVAYLTGTGNGSVGNTSVQGGTVTTGAALNNVGNFPYNATIPSLTFQAASGTQDYAYNTANLTTTGTAIGPDLQDYLSNRVCRIQFDMENCRDGLPVYNKTTQTGFITVGQNYSFGVEAYPDLGTITAALGSYNQVIDVTAGSPLVLHTIAWPNGNNVLETWLSENPYVKTNPPQLLSTWFSSIRNYVGWARSGKLLFQFVGNSPTDIDAWPALMWAYNACFGATSAAEVDVNEQFSGKDRNQVSMSEHFIAQNPNDPDGGATATVIVASDTQAGSPHAYTSLVDWSAYDGTSKVTKWIDGICVGITNQPVSWGPGFNLHWQLFLDVSCTDLSDPGALPFTSALNSWSVVEVDAAPIGNVSGLNARATAYINALTSAGITLAAAYQTALHTFANGMDNLGYTANGRLPYHMYIMCGPSQAMSYIDFFNPTANALSVDGTGLTWSQSNGFQGNGTGWLDFPVNMSTAGWDATNISFLAYINGQGGSNTSGIIRANPADPNAASLNVGWAPAVYNNNVLQYYSIAYNFGFYNNPNANAYVPSSADDFNSGFLHIMTFTPYSGQPGSELIVNSNTEKVVVAGLQPANFQGFPSQNPQIAVGNEGVKFIAIAPFWSAFEGDVFRDALLIPLIQALAATAPPTPPTTPTVPPTPTPAPTPTPTVPTPTVTPTPTTPTTPPTAPPTPTSPPTPTAPPTPTQTPPTTPTVPPTPTPTIITPTVPTVPAGQWTYFGSAITGTTITITGLALLTTYDFSVIAMNSAGSVLSAIVTATTGNFVATPTLPTLPKIPTPPPTTTSIVTPADADQFYQVITSGAYDSAFLNVFQSFVNGGYTSFYIRPGYEMNRASRIWNVGSSAATAADFVLAFQRISDLAHNFTGATIRVIWNPYVGDGSSPLSYLSFYPGDDYVDVIGIDTYGGNTGQDPTLSSSDVSNYTVLAACAMAKSRGKSIAIPETGILVGAQAPNWTVTFITNLAAIIKGAGVPIEFVSIWDYAGSGAISWSNTSDNQSAIVQAYRSGFAETTTGPYPTGEIVVTSITQTSLSFTWTPPSVGDPPFTYQPQYRVTGTTQWFSLPTTTGITATAYNLQSNTSYDLQIVTTNSSGTSVSATTTAITLSALPYGGAVTGNQVSSALYPILLGPTNGTVPEGYLLQVSGVAVQDTVSGVYALNVQVGSSAFVSMSNSGVVVNGSGTNNIMFSGTFSEMNAALSTLTYSNPIAGTDTISINILDPAAQQTTMIINIVVTVITAVPGQISNLAITNATSTSLVVIWNAPITGTQPFYYQVQYRVTGTLSWSSNDNSVINVTNYVVINLSSSTTYDLQVIISNSIGTTTSTIVTGATAATASLAPNAVTNVTSLAIASNQVTLSWNAPTQGTSLVYTVLYRLTNSIGTPTIPTIPTVPTITIPTVPTVLPTVPTRPTPTVPPTPTPTIVSPTPTIPTPTPTRPTPTVAPTPTRPTPTALPTPTPTIPTIPTVPPTTPTIIPTPTVPTVPAGTIITPTSGGSVVDAAGNVWSLDTGGNLFENNAVVTGGGGTSALTVVNGVIWAQDATSGTWYTYTDGTFVSQGTAQPFGSSPTTPTRPTPTATPTPTRPTTPTTPTSNFSVKNGQIIAPNGSTFIGKGINVYDNQMGQVSTNAQATPLTSFFPGINFVRLACYGYNDPSYYSTFITQLTSLNIVVEIENHRNFNADGSSAGDAGGGAGVELTGSLLTAESNWYAALAAAYQNNPYVWFGTNNEPPDDGTGYGSAGSQAGLSTWQQATYNAIRNAGNNNIIFMELYGGGNPGAIGAGYGMTSSVYASMTNIVWDLHFYPWVTNYTTDQATVNQTLLGQINAPSNGGVFGVAAAQTITSKDGVVPVFIGETGIAAGGNQSTTGGPQVLQAAYTLGYGAAAWGWCPDLEGTDDNSLSYNLDLTNNGQYLGTYGNIVAGYIAQ
jgi:hypothetical protein